MEKNKVAIQMQAEFGILRSFCVGLIFFNALMVLSHFIGSKPFLCGTGFRGVQNSEKGTSNRICR